MTGLVLLCTGAFATGVFEAIGRTFEGMIFGVRDEFGFTWPISLGAQLFGMDFDGTTGVGCCFDVDGPACIDVSNSGRLCSDSGSNLTWKKCTSI